MPPSLLNGSFAVQMFKKETKKGIEKTIAAHLLHGMPKNVLEATFKRIFVAADRDGSGYLDRKEFTMCLKRSDLGLTRRVCVHTLT